MAGNPDAELSEHVAGLVVEGYVNAFATRDLALERVPETDELLMLAALRFPSEDLADQDNHGR